MFKVNSEKEREEGEKWLSWLCKMKESEHCFKVGSRSKLLGRRGLEPV